MRENNSSLQELNSSRQQIKFIKYWIPLFFYAILIFYISSIPGKDIPALFKFQDVVFHIMEYAVFAFMLSRAFKAYFPQLNFPRRLYWVFLISIVYAASDEWHQSFVPGRCAAITDVISDGIGVLVANFIYR